VKLTNETDPTGREPTVREEEGPGDDALARALGALPRSVEPSRDLWAGVATRVDASRRRVVRMQRALTGAAVLLAAASVALAVRVAPHPPADRDEARAPAAVSGAEAHQASDTTPGEVVVPEEATYQAAVAALTPSFDERLRALSPADASAIETSVHAIEAAIAATRESLEQTPDDADLRAELDDEYEQEIHTMNDVLDWTTRS
jgi:hypothetical protein